MSEIFQQLRKIKIEKISIAGIELKRELIQSLDIYESITQPAITGTISLADYQGLKELKEVFAGDSIELSYMTENSDNLTLKYSIFASQDNSIEQGKQFHTSVFSFCSSWMIDGMTRQISKPYKNKYIHEIIEDLLKECGAKIGYIEPTKQLLETFVTPLWTATHSIKHLLNYAKNTNDVGGYVIFTDMKTDKVNVVTLDYLMRENLGVYNKFAMNTGNTAFEGRIDQITFETDFDIIRNLNIGMGTYRVYGYDFDRNKFYEMNSSVVDYSHKHLANKLPINSKYIDKKYSTNLFTPLFSTFADGTVEDKILKDLLDGYQKTFYSHVFSDTFKINISSNASSSRRAGQIAQVDIPSIREHVKADTKTQNAKYKDQHKHFKGKMLIRDIRHIIVNETYNQIISLVLDGYYDYKNSEPADWKK